MDTKVMNMDLKMVCTAFWKQFLEQYEGDKYSIPRFRLTFKNLGKEIYRPQCDSCKVVRLFWLVSLRLIQ